MIVVKEYDKILFGVLNNNQYLSAEEVEKELEKLKEQEHGKDTMDNSDM